MSAPRDPGVAAPPPILQDPDPGPLRWCLHALYDACWILAILATSPWWLVRCALDPRFRAMALARLGAGLPRIAPAGHADSGARAEPGDSRRRVLVHGVSVGEVKAAQALARAIERDLPGFEVAISTTTDTGFDVASRLYPGRPVVRFPLDLSFLVRRFLARVDPALVVLVELEIWPNFLREANRRGVPVAVVNGRITGRSFGQYRLFRRLLPQFKRLTLLCVQDEDYARRFEDLAGSRARILVTGNIKADGLRAGRVEPPADLARLLGGRPGQPVVVAGSTHEPEERLVADALRRAAPLARLVLVPRHPERAAAVARERSGQLLSRLRAGEVPDPSRPAVVDSMGELESVYALADLVFVGGSLVPHGGQNVLEPAAQGRPVVCGPHVWNFAQEAALLERAGAIRVAPDAAGLDRALFELLGDEAARERMSRAGIAAVEAQKGATALTLSALRERCVVGSGTGPPRA